MSGTDSKSPEIGLSDFSMGLPYMTSLNFF